jgi:hypothetical protein
VLASGGTGTRPEALTVPDWPRGKRLPSGHEYDPSEFTLMRKTCAWSVAASGKRKATPYIRGGGGATCADSALPCWQCA